MYATSDSSMGSRLFESKRKRKKYRSVERHVCVLDESKNALDRLARRFLLARSSASSSSSLIRLLSIASLAFFSSRSALRSVSSSSRLRFFSSRSIRALSASSCSFWYASYLCASTSERLRYFLPSPLPGFLEAAICDFISEAKSMMGVTVLIWCEMCGICLQRNMVEDWRGNTIAKGEVMPSDDVIGAQRT